MNQLEKMIWASVYASEFRDDDVNGAIIRSDRAVRRMRDQIESNERRQLHHDWDLEMERQEEEENE